MIISLIVFLGKFVGKSDKTVTTLLNFMVRLLSLTINLEKAWLQYRPASHRTWPCGAFMVRSDAKGAVISSQRGKQIFIVKSPFEVPIASLTSIKVLQI